MDIDGEVNIWLRFKKKDKMVKCLQAKTYLK